MRKYTFLINISVIFFIILGFINLTGCGSDDTSGTSPTCDGNCGPIISPSASPSASFSPITSPCPVKSKMIALHHCIGNDLTIKGQVEENIATYNGTYGCNVELWEYCYNIYGLRNPQLQFVGIYYNIPNDDFTPAGYNYLFTSNNSDAVYARTQLLNNYQVIILFSENTDIQPYVSKIETDQKLQQYKDYYIGIRNFIDSHPEKLFILVTPTPLHRLATNLQEAARARNFANFLSSQEFLAGHPNIAVFDFFNYLADSNNVLKYEYERSHVLPDNKPNDLADQTIGPIYARFIIDAARAY